jgi:hypothetical protein
LPVNRVNIDIAIIKGAKQILPQNNYTSFLPLALSDFIITFPKSVKHLDDVGRIFNAHLAAASA